MALSYPEIAKRAWLGGIEDGTPCGRGSTLENTKAIRELLPKIVAEYGIHSICDAGAGDLHWIRHLTWDVDYRAFDLVPRHKDVQPLDITKDVLPRCDLILCRFVLGHMGPGHAVRALFNLRQSGATYLLASNPQAVDYKTEPFGTFNRWDLERAPFGLGEPLGSWPDCVEHDICLWKLDNE